ncbi:MAG: hypothetical protein KKC76_06085 [Proteobacteria bacterium]|nr:hypothetical protein [Pseudomonadota bacterium]MBU4295545.1 hypothetical protein [Pseudomonadota bacterium]MCG2748421.1 hypothetical protein [Desulfobulbaceae bacterium]
MLFFFAALFIEIGLQEARAGAADGLEVSFSLPAKSLLYAQDVECFVTLKNSGSSPLDVPLPPLDNSPIIVAHDLQTGMEKEYRRERERFPISQSPAVFPPGLEHAVSFSLLDVTGPLEPGKYEIRVIWEYGNDSQRSESNGVSLMVLPVKPLSLNLVNAVQGHGAYKFGVFVDGANKTPQILLKGFSMMGGGGDYDVRPVSVCASSIEPVLSEPASGKSARSHWIAWLEEKMLHYLYFDDLEGVREQGVMKLPEGDVAIVTPLYSAVFEDEHAAPGGELLLAVKEKSGSLFGMHSVLLAKRGRVVATAEYQGPMPGWIKAHFMADGKRLVTYMQPAGAETEMYLTHWPGSTADVPAPGKVAGWSGALVGAGAIIDGQDTVRGGTLLFSREDNEQPGLLLQTWSLTHGVTYVEGLSHSIDWPPGKTVREARVRLDDNGKVAALIADGEGAWYVYDGAGGLRPVPAEIKKTLLPLELAFYEGSGDPVLIVGTETHGFRTMQLDGSSLPQRQSPK